MRNNGRGALLALVVFAFLMSMFFVSAEVLVGQTESLYNIGDMADWTITVKPQTDTSNFLVAELICGGGSVELFKSPYTIKAGEQKEVAISTSLGDFLTQGMEGNCFIRATFGNEIKEGQGFQLSRGVAVNLNIEGVVFAPGDVVNVHGVATKDNGEALEGFLEVFVDGIDFSFTGEVAAGVFNFDFRIPRDGAAGNYELTARAYEKDGAGIVINEGESSGVIKIKQVITELGIALDEESVFPGNDFGYATVVYDQSGGHVGTDVSVVVNKPDGSVTYERIVRSDERDVFYVENYDPPGYWSIKTKVGELEFKKTFLVEEFRKVEFFLEEDTLIVMNVGNVPYSGAVDISIGEVSEIKNLENLGVGDSKRFRLRAPDGDYEIGAGSGGEKEGLGVASLTGRAISADQLGGSFSFNGFGGLIWVMIVLIVLVLVVFFVRKLVRKKVLFKGLSLGERSSGRGPADSENMSSVIDKGEKHESAIVSLHLGNRGELTKGGEALKTLDSVLWKAKEHGGKVYSDGDFRIVVLVGTLTKEKDNTLRAIRVGRMLERMLSEHNKRAKEKIDFGVGINVGDLIVEQKDGKFRFMSLDNTIASTKAISQNSKGEVLISDKMHRRTAGKAKSEKKGKMWKVTKVIDRSTHQDYIRKFKTRQDVAGKKK